MGSLSVLHAPSEDLSFTACVAQFGMLLRDSQFSGTATYQGITWQLASPASIEGDDYKEEFFYLVRQMTKRG